MSNQELHLVKGRHVVCVADNGGLVVTEDGNINIQDLQDNSLYSVPLTHGICDFFGLFVSQNSDTAGTFGISPVTVAPPVNIQNKSKAQQAKKRSQAASKLGSTTEVAQWNLELENALIKIWRQRQNEFGDSKTNLEVWKEIRDDLWKERYAYEIGQVQNKWKNLRKSYMAFIDNGGPNNSGGEPMKKPKHFDDFEDIYRKTPHVTPVIVSSKRMYPLETVNVSDEEVEVENSSQLNSTSKTCKVQTKLQKELSSWAESMKAESERKERVKTERYNTMQEMYKKMADAQERSAKCLKTFTKYLMNKDK